MDTIIWILLILVLFYIIAGFNKEILRRWDEKLQRQKEIEEMTKKDKNDN